MTLDGVSRAEFMSSRERLETFAEQMDLTITWNDTLKMVSVEGKVSNAAELSEKIATLAMGGDDDAGTVEWRGGMWMTRAVVLGEKCIIAIDVDKSSSIDQVLGIRRETLLTMHEKLPAWKQRICDQIYPIYVERFSNGKAVTVDTFGESLRLTERIDIDPENSRIETYFTAAPHMVSHVINICEEAGVEYPPALEWA